jgi:putative inorganic carbon (HCO3(-)) transporter
LAIWFVAPPEVKQRVATIINPMAYIQGWGTLGLRHQIWTYSVDVIEKYPFLGVGYGWDVFEDYVNANYEPLSTGETIAHAHNNYLEVAAETGLFGLLVFVALNVLLFVQIFRAWRMTERQTKPRFVVAGFFGLLVAINMYGMSNYSLRYTIGMLVWICFALMTLLPSIVRFIPLYEENGNGAPRPTEPAQPAATSSEPPGEVREETAAEPEETGNLKRTTDNGQPKTDDE